MTPHLPTVMTILETCTFASANKYYHLIPALVTVSSCKCASLLGPFHGAIAVPSVTRCHCRRCRRGHRCAGGVWQYSGDTWWIGV